MIWVVNNLMDEYAKMFGEEIELPMFWELEEKEQIKILKECIKKKQQIYQNEYYNKNYMEEVI